jgi:aminotransferase in exopolysaccharide biosynthesis
MSDVPSARIPLCEPVLAGNERAYLDECLRTNFVSSVGPFVERFEQSFAAYVGAKHAVACASGTAAIHVALRLCGVDAGDEVFVPTLTFIASANPIAYERATPVLIDAEPRTWNMDPALVVEELERRHRLGLRQPKVVEAVHLLGHPCDIEPLAEACDRYGVILVEDASEALGARYRTGRFAGRHVGTIGRLGCFSFNGNKVITSGGGGMLTTDDPELARRAKHLTTQARLPGAEYRHDEVGYNYRLTNLAAALGLAQLEQLPGFLAHKRAQAAAYAEGFAHIDDVIAAPDEAWAESSFWLYSVRLTGRAGRVSVRDRLSRAGIDTRPIWSPLHTMPLYAAAPRVGGAVAERLFTEGLSLPSTAGLGRDGARRVAAELAMAVGLVAGGTE